MKTNIKKCDCAAHNSDECICGAWDDLDPYNLKCQLLEAQKDIQFLRKELNSMQISKKQMLEIRENCIYSMYSLIDSDPMKSCMDINDFKKRAKNKYLNNEFPQNNLFNIKVDTLVQSIFEILKGKRNESDN